MVTKSGPHDCTIFTRFLAAGDMMAYYRVVRRREASDC